MTKKKSSHAVRVNEVINKIPRTDAYLLLSNILLKLFAEQDFPSILAHCSVVSK